MSGMADENAEPSTDEQSALLAEIGTFGPAQLMNVPGENGETVTYYGAPDGSPWVEVSRS